jgi:hypothetical protein
VVVVVLLLDGDELMLPLEPELLPDEPEPDEPDDPMLPVLPEPLELLGLLLEPPLEPLELGLLELGLLLEPPDEPDEPDEPELPMEEVPPELPDEPLAPPLAESEPPPLPQALRERAAAATTARTVLRERVDAFMRGNSCWGLRVEGRLSRRPPRLPFRRRNDGPGCLRLTLGRRCDPAVVSHCRWL